MSERRPLDKDTLLRMSKLCRPEEPELVKDCWLEIDADGMAFFDSCLEPEEGTIAIAHIRFNGERFETVSQEKV